MQYRAKPRKCHTYAFNSLAELSRYINDTPPTWSSRSSDQPSQGADWDLGATLADAVRMARDGWLEGAERAQEALRALVLKSPSNETVYSVAGYRPSVGRFVAGAPRCMVRRAPDSDMGAGRVLTLYVPTNALAGVSARYMANFGLGVAQYLNQLETDGTRVEIHGVICSSVSGVRVTHTWKIKDAEQPLDLAVLAFSIGHPAMFRRLGFALRERCAAPQDWAYGFTVPCKLTDFINPPLGAYILNGMAKADEIARTPQAALAYIERALDALLAGSEGDELVQD